MSVGPGSTDLLEVTNLLEVKFIKVKDSCGFIELSWKGKDTAMQERNELYDDKFTMRAVTMG